MGIQPIRKIVVPEIPDKLYFRIGDVARLCEVPAYVLRFWETEFPQLKPHKGGTGQRLYRKRDVEMALRIKSLLYDQGYTIPGARGVFKTEAKVRETGVEPFASPVAAPEAPEVPDTSSATGPFANPTAEPKAAGKIAIAQVASAAHIAPSASFAVATPSSDYDAGAEVRRQVKLHALRAELQALLELLQTPARKLPPSVAETRSQPARPRLMLEPRPAAPKLEPVRPETLRLVPFGRRDLSPGE